MSDKVLLPTVIALGYFDSVHEGHKKVIREAKKCADEMGATLTVFTFKGNLKAMLSGGDDKSVYLPAEREKLLYELGADEIFFAPVDFNFLSMGKLAFLNYLNRKYNIKCYVSGKDYRFGRFGKGDVDDINRYAAVHKQSQMVVDTFLMDGEKVSTTSIKALLSAGNVKKANELLGRKFSVTGAVYKDRSVGSKIGFPTANVAVDKDKFMVGDGVYAGEADVDGKTYRAIINYGARPTFNLAEKALEAHIDGFNGEIYGKQLTLRFCFKMRGVVKFNSEIALKEQLEKDLRFLREGKYD